MKRIKIALVGDFDEKIHTLVALNRSIEHCAGQLPFEVQPTWISTESLINTRSQLRNYNGIWVVPGSPYKNDSAVYEAIKLAREDNIPIMGSCGGFQYMIIEYARNVLDIADAGHEESDSNAVPIISKLSCSLKGLEERIVIADKTSWLYEVLKKVEVVGRYYCSYGVNPVYYEKLNKFPLIFTAFSQAGEVRAFELRTHRFFRGTLFQPSLDSSSGNPNPLIKNFFEVCSE